MGAIARSAIVMVVWTGYVAGAPRAWTTTSDLETWPRADEKTHEAMRASLKVHEVPEGQYELEVFEKPDLTTVIVYTERRPATGMAALDAHEKRTRSRLRGSDREIEYQIRRTAKTSVIDLTHEIALGARMWSRCVTGFEADRLVSISATCVNSDENECKALLQTIDLDAAQLVPLPAASPVQSEVRGHEIRPTVDPESTAGKAGRITGIVVLILVFGLWFWRNYGPRRG